MNKEYTEWEIYVGRLLVTFGDIELLTYKLFELWLADNIAQNYTLDERFKKLIGYISGQPKQGELTENIKNLLIRAKQVNYIRHQVAHNPTILKKFDNSEYKVLLTDLRKKNKPLSLEEVYEYADEAVNLKSELFILISNYTNKGIDTFFT